MILSGPVAWMRIGIKGFNTGNGFLQIGKPITIRVHVRVKVGLRMNPFPDIAHPVAVPHVSRQLDPGSKGMPQIWMLDVLEPDNL